jgi:hypothetical protein
VLRGNGDGTFDQVGPPSYLGEYVTGKTSQMVAVADFRGNGKLDLAVPNFGGGISILLGNGDGTFQQATSAQPGGANPEWIAVADFNKDGNADLAVSFGNSMQLAVLIGNGDGTFQAPMILKLLKLPGWVGAAPVNYRVGLFVRVPKRIGG